MRQQCDNQQWETVISSPASRCLNFASDWSRQRQCVLHIEAAWQEIDFGAWDGLTAEEIEQRHPGSLRDFYANPDSYTPPSGEPYAQFANRVRQAWEGVLNTFPGQRILVVTHGGVIRALYAQLLSTPPRHSLQIDVPHACLTRFSCFQEADNRFVQLNFHKPA